MPNNASSDFTGERPCSTGSNSGRSASLFFLMISRARSRDSNNWTWLVTASASSALRSSLRSPFGRRNTFSRPSIRIRTSDLYRGVTRLTVASESTAASTVGTTIQPRLRISAWPRACRSRSPEAGTAAGFWTAGAGFAMALWTRALSLPARQNAKRIVHSRGRHDSTRPLAITLH